MKNVKFILIFTVFIGLQSYLIRSLEGDLELLVLLGLPAVLTLLLLFNLSVRNSIAFKAYFLSPINIFTSKFKAKKIVDIPKDLLFDKLLELIATTDLKIQSVDKNKMEIFVSSSLTFSSWGENIYIELKEGSGTTTEIHFSSTTFFQIHAWGKNESNFHNFVNALDDSLII